MRTFVVMDPDENYDKSVSSRLKFNFSDKKVKTAKCDTRVASNIDDSDDLFTSSCSSSLDGPANGIGHREVENATRVGNSGKKDQEPRFSGAINVKKRHFDHCVGGEFSGCSNISKKDPSHALQSCKDNEALGIEPKISNFQGVPREDTEWKNMEMQLCQRYKPCHDKPCSNNYDYNVPSTSGLNKTVSIADAENNHSRDRKRPSNFRPKSNLEAEDTSSDTGNDDYSLGSEDGCIYTYRGGAHLADLPSSFFSLDMGLPIDNHLPTLPLYGVRPEGSAEENRGRVSRASSPDMDFLEMDFDPGPSCEAYSGGDASPVEELEESSSLKAPEEQAFARGTTPEANIAGPSEPVVLVVEKEDIEQAVEVCEPVPEVKSIAHVDLYQPSTSRANLETSIVPEVIDSLRPCGILVTHVNARGERLLVRRTTSRWPPAASVSLHCSSGDLVSPRELLDSEMAESDAVWSMSGSYSLARVEGQAFDKVNLSSALYHCTMAKKLMVEKPNADFIEGADTSNLACEPGGESSAESGVAEVGRCMIWSEREACERQVTQIGTSACGATSVINVFLALNVPVDVDRISCAVGTRQRANNAQLPRYLLSRAVAGCTAAGLVAGLQRGSEGLVTARFFPTHPERVVSLSHWLADWIALGAVPILTLNLQAVGEAEVADAWHHQMVFGVSARGIYLSNPVECVHESALWPQLCSPSTLLVRTRDVLARFTPRTDLRPLMAVPDQRWFTYNVLGQVVNVIREWQASGGNESGVRTRHIRIPAAYQAGVTVAALTGSEAHKRLMRAQPLPKLLPYLPHT